MDGVDEFDTSETLALAGLTLIGQFRSLRKLHLCQHLLPTGIAVNSVKTMVLI